MPTDMLGNVLSPGDWIVFGTKLKNNAETRIAQVIQVTPTFQVRSVKEVLFDLHGNGAVWNPVSGAVNIKNVLRLPEKPF